MKNKKTKNDKKKASNKASLSNKSRKKQKKTKKSASGDRTSSASQIQSQNEDPFTASGNQSELQSVQDCPSVPLPATGKANAQTQTKCSMKNKVTQTESTSHSSCHTQTESDPISEAKIQCQENAENDSHKTNEEKAADDSMAAPADPGGDKKKGMTTTSICDEVMQEDDINIKKGEQAGEDSQDAPKSTDIKTKSYAEAASSKDSKDKKNQTAAGQKGKTHDNAPQRKPSPVRGPTGKPMFTFYVYLLLEKSFKFNKDKDKLLICFESGSYELQITLFRTMKKDGYLIEANFSVDECYAKRGSVFNYSYAVRQQGKEKVEIATRHFQIPFNHLEKELHIFEGHVTHSSPGWLLTFFTSADEFISEAWHNSAYLLLNRLFEKWEPSNQEAMKTFTQLLNQYQWCFLSASKRVFYNYNLSAPSIKVFDLIEAKLVKILNGKMEGKTSVNVSPLAVGLSVFQVTSGCNVRLGIKDLGLLCKLVSSAPALGQVQEIQNSFPTLQYTVLGLMNQCARLLLSETVLLVPLLLSVRQPGADSGRFGRIVEEPDWTGLQYVEFRLYREKIRASSDKRRMILELVEKHRPLAKDKPHVLRAWLSMMAIDDLSMFAKSTDVVPEQVIQSLMYRLRDFQSFRITNSEQNLEVTAKILTYLLNCVDKDKERLMSSKWLGSICQCCRNIHKNTCTMTQLVPAYEATVLSFRLVLKMAEIQFECLSKHGEEKASEKISLLKQIEATQEEFSHWKDNLLREPLFRNSRLMYPNEIELWNAFFWLECSIPSVTEQWLSKLEKSLRKRISEVNDIQQVQICCLKTSAEAIEKSHTTLQTCFQDLCFSAITRLCQAGKEGNLLQTLQPHLKDISSSILSLLITESTARFGKDRVLQLLSDQSAVRVLLLQGDWSHCKLNEEASHVMSMCQATLGDLVISLCQGNIPFGHLQIILKHQKQFQELYKKCKKHIKSDRITIDADRLLNQREKDYQALLEQRKHIDVLIKMIGKISEVIHVREISQLEKEHKTDMQPVGLNELVGVQSCFSNEDLKDISTGKVLYYRAILPTVLDAARDMHIFQDSNLILKSWMDKANRITGSQRLSLSLEEVLSENWQPSLRDFFQLGTRIGHGHVTFEEVDKAVEGCGDKGDGARLKKEMSLMATNLETYPGLEKNWLDLRLSQIQEYRQLHHAAESASAILKIKARFNLKGDFSHICSLTQLREDSFKKMPLTSLSRDLISAKQKLSHINHQHTDCLVAFLNSEKLVDWVKSTIKNRSELKVFTDLASISAGENDLEIDKLRNFQDAVMGYSPFLYSLHETAGFEDFLALAQEVWDALQKDEKLPEKLIHSSYWLEWLKGLSETHGSVEKSSISSASAINTHGVYHVGWPAIFSGKKSLGSVLCVKVKNSTTEKTFSLDDLLDLQNKLMLMSSKGEHSKEQVNKFTEIFEGVQRMGSILMQLCLSGNVFFQDLCAFINCNPEMAPCINLNFPLLGKHIVYHGNVAEELQKVCRTMEDCHENWRSFMSELRSQFYALNYYTSEQVVYLCHWINKVCEKGMPVPQQMWHLLTPLKPDGTLSDIRHAFAKAKESLQSELQSHFSADSVTSEESMDISRTIQHRENSNIDEDTEEERVDIFTENMLEELSSNSKIYSEESAEEGENFTEGDQDELDVGSSESGSEEDMNFSVSYTQTHELKMTNTVKETLENLWQDYRNNMPKYLTQYIDIKTLAQFLSCFSALNKLNIMRKLPSILQDGKPNLILCPDTEIITTTLALYMKSPEQGFPSIDEVLMCQEDTSEEEVEIFLRRCLGQSAPSHNQKIYTLVNPGLLTYDVSVALAEHFEAMERNSGSNFRMVIVCPVNQDRYVPSFFSNYKVQAGLNVSLESVKQYLRHHLTTSNVHGHHSKVFPEGISSWLITSRRAAVGKSLYVTRMFQNFKKTFPNATHLTVRLIEPNVDIDCVVQTLCDKQSSLKAQDPVLLHIDTAAVHCGLEQFLFRLLILGCLSDSEGKLWRRNSAHLIAVEALIPDSAHHKQTHKESNQGLLSLLPTIHCKPPKEVKYLELKIISHEKCESLNPLMDIQEFESEGVQRPYQYLRRFNRNENLDHFKYKAGSVEGNKVDCLHHLLSNCGLEDPSWAELKHFTWFLNLQLRDCENSGFCDPNFFGSILTGFKSFIVKFMIHMARDFASPSLNISDQSPSLLPERDNEDVLARLSIRKRWENESHPYIFFNADRLTMTFLGFHVKQGSTQHSVNVVDPQTDKVLMGNVMSLDLLTGLKNQGISFSEDFDKLPRKTKIKKISLVVGADIREQFDPDPTYELTSDNVMKMLAIHMRFRCEIPVIIMGETGCGKTRLVKFLCDLQREGRGVENMKLVKVHGGTNADTIYKKVREAEELAQTNSKKYKLDTILFFDEANTTESIFAIKEVLCDKTVQGVPLKQNSGLKIIAACNPYRRHTHKMIERLERAGLGYRVKAGETHDRLGKVPMRQLVYRVHQLPPSMIPLVWDFGQLSDSAEYSYIQQIVCKQIEEHSLPFQCQSIITRALAASQRHMRLQVDECSFVSLRDVERSMRVLVWFYKHRQYLFPKSQETDIAQMTYKCLALALGICYYPSLEFRDNYLQNIAQYFPPPLNSKQALELEISSCQDFFLQTIQTRETIAKNLALKENVFLMVVCIELKIPLFLVGKPGSSKSLAKTVVAYAMQGQASSSELFQKLKEVHMVSFQCSPHSSSEGIIGTFRNCARFQKDKNLDENVSVVVLDEIGLAEDSPQMPLKTLHPLLEDGCIDNDRPDPHMKVGFVGISNWALDPAKMNRGIFVSRWDPSENELVETAKGICSSPEPVLHKISHLLPKLAKGFLSICKSDSDQFFGLRDFYSLVKMIFAVEKNTDSEPSDRDLTLAQAILRNFSGQKDNFDPLFHFQDLFSNPHEVPMINTLEMVKQNLDHKSEEECRYLLLLTTNNAALYIIQQCIFSNDGYTCPEIVFGSGFPKDQEYAQICRNISRVKSCMETGRTVILLNLLNLYESLYDALNQYYVYFCGQQYVDLGLGSHRVKCRVHKDFRLVVIEDQETVYDKFPIPLKNRLEKHIVDRSTDLTPWQQRVLKKLKNWVNEFSQYPEASASDFSSSDAFVGFHGDACASALLQALEQRKKQDHQDMGDRQVDSNMPSRRTSTEDNLNEHEEQTYHQEEGVRSHDTVPLDDKESDLTGSDTGKTLLDENNEGVVLMDVDVNEGNIEAEQEQDALGEIPMSVDMDIRKEIRLNKPKESKDEEEEVYEYAKHFLLNCATPDSVLRLKNSRLGNHEVERLQRLYFHQQDHHSLRAFMYSHLKKSDKDKKRFIEVTTFSSLLTKADVRNLAQALGLSMERLLLLSLHQFDTEASFCSKIRDFMKTAQLSLHILLVQIDIEESLCKNGLIASAKYCTMNEFVASQSEDPNCCIVFITKLSRFASGNNYIGFQGGAWISTHIDDLRDTKDMSLDLSVFCGTPISKLLSEPAQPDAMELEEEEEEETTVKNQSEESAYLHSLSLVKSCTQKAVSLLRDFDNKASRSTERMDTLLGLLENDLGHHGARFQEVLLKRLVLALAQREENMHKSGDWVNRQIMKREALQEGGTLRHTLWRCLQGVLTPILAHMLEVLDRDCNLDLVYCTGLSEGLVQFWLDIFDDGQILDLSVAKNSSSLEQEIDVQSNLVVGGKARNCTAPFSWLINLYCHNLWEEAQFVQGIEQSSYECIQQFVSAVTGSQLGGYMEKLSKTEHVDLGQRYLTDFVILSFKIKTEEEVRVFSTAVLGCVAALQQDMRVTPDLSPAWIMAAAQHFSPRLDALLHILQVQPDLARLILKQSSQKDQPDMHEDILALGICVEKTKLQSITSIPQCSVFLGRVELLQPCLQRVFSPTYCSLCRPGCLKHLDAIKSVWQGILVVAAFIEQVVMKVNSSDEKLVALTLKHCSQLQRLVEECSDLQRKACPQQLIRILNEYNEESISRELRFGLKCPVCLEDLVEPCALQCEHVFCLSCMKRCMQGKEAQCPKCRTQLPPNYQPAVSSSIELSLKQHRELRRCCNSFFLEVVSRFCFSKRQHPQEDLVELLFSLLISAQGDVYKTRELTPFLECVDHSPVVRSVLIKLLLQYSFDQVKGHIQTYLKNLEHNLLDDEDRMELYRLFVNCFQDSLLCVDLSETLEAKELQRHQEEDIKFLSRLARKQTPSREQQPAEFLLSMARLRMCLDTAARILPRAVGHQRGECADWEQKMLEQVKAVCEYANNDWYRVYLLRTLNRHAGTDFVQAMMSISPYEWVFPAELLRLQRLIPVEVDRFLCCGEQYRSVRNAVGQVLLESKADALKAALQNVSNSESVKSVLLALALYKQVTCRIGEPDPAMHPGAEALELLKDSVRKSTPGSGYLRELCTSLLSNPPGGLMSCLHVRANESAKRRLLLELLVHAIAVFHSGSPILYPLHLIASRPQTMRDTFLPTMPDDNTSMVIQSLNERKLKQYYCKNGHLSLVGECGKPVAVGKCDTCGVPIGGKDHKAEAGFTPVQGALGDRTQPGHILNDAAHRSEAPNRDLPMAQSSLLRLFLHLAMLHGSSLNHQDIRAMIHPTVHNVQEFLWCHLEKDMENLGKTLNLNWDDVAIVVHLILNNSVQPPTVHSQQRVAEWSSRHAREQWERQVCETVINPILQDMNRHLHEAQEKVTADDKLSSSALMKMLKGDPRSLLSLPSECATHHASFWTPPDILTVEHLSQLIAQKHAEKQVPLLSLFLIKVQYIRHLACLPDLAALLSDLIRIVQPDTDTHSTTIIALLHNIPAGLRSNKLKKRLQIFFRVWNHLRMELANNTAAGVDPKLCEKDITMDSPSQFLRLSHHGPGSCLQALIDQLSETHNSLVREAQKLSHKEDSDYSVPVGELSESQLAMCHPEKEFLPLVLAHCHYTLVKGKQTASDYDLQAIQKQLHRRFLAGKPRIQTETEKYLKRYHQDFSTVLKDVRCKIPQEPLKSSVCSSIRTMLRSFTDVCDAVYALEIGLRFLGKTGGHPKSQLLSYLHDSLKMKQHISSSVAKALADIRLDQCTATWQLLTCWKSELKLRSGQDPIPRLSQEYRETLSADMQKELNEFLNLTNVEHFTLELHEILLLKTDINSGNSYGSKWDIKSTLESHLEEKGAPVMPGIDNLSDKICLSKSAEVWRLAVKFKR
ncbi:E3 ubiquitin-protein ligase rnf213-beta isoform X2 [Tachysurus fulvidraco]|uniref:E3 ubiquitin-protein ligase rnf213-beta isoform X2 n=1 Tax=Tachysurus fulvidraco TaxID=1234273 RepID=UPI001FEECCB4|nr:E3 ubiquitin-protein ligase rnf213-beta isoform X2 [Tachysurus fulvidraco]